MQGIKNLIKDLKVGLGFKAEEVATEETPKVEIKFVDVKAGDLNLRIDGEIIEGSTVAVVSTDANGNEVLDAAPDGEYILEDGRTLVIQNSTIAQIVEAGEVETDMKTEETQMSSETLEFSEVKELITLIKEAYEYQTKAIEDIKKEIESVKGEVEQVKKSPAAAEIKLSKSEKIASTLQNKKDRKEKLADLFSKHTIKNI
ncbi:MAG: hypothetical protein ACKOW9_03210 [Candidatus Paceibacterota bacterium]